MNKIVRLFRLLLIPALLAPGLPLQAHKLPRVKLSGVSKATRSAGRQLERQVTRELRQTEAALRQLDRNLNRLARAEMELELPVKGRRFLEDFSTPSARRLDKNKKLGKGKHKRLPFKVEDKTNQLLSEYKNPVDALHSLWNIEDQLGANVHLFEPFCLAYYSKPFPALTTPVRKLFDKIHSLSNRNVEDIFTKRMRFLSETKEALILATDPKASAKLVRLRFLSDIDRLSPQNFNANQLVFSLERKMTPQFVDESLHFSGMSRFSVGSSGEFPIFNYNGPLDYLPNFYRYLLNGKSPRKPLFLQYDREAGALAIYNQDRTRWLRISDHEYAFPDRLHVHFNEVRTINFTTTQGLERQENVLFNLSIPIAKPSDLPNYNVKDFLERYFVQKPATHFRGDARVSVEERSIF